MGWHSCALVTTLVIVATLVIIYWVYLEYRKSRPPGKSGGKHVVGFAQWKEESATKKFPIKGKCSLYDFGLGRPTLRMDVLDRMHGREYAPYEYCMDANQIYAAKVKRTCHKYLDGIRSTVNHCNLPGGKRAAIGSEQYVYSYDFCSQDNPHSVCKGIVAAVSVESMWWGPPVIISKKGSSKIIDVLGKGESYGVDSIFHLAFYNSKGKETDSGDYVIITHKATGITISAGSSESGAMWRILINSAYFLNPTQVTDTRLVYLGVIQASDWAKFPLSAQQFGEFAAKKKLKMAKLDSEKKTVNLVEMKVDACTACRFDLKVLEYSLPT